MALTINAIALRPDGGISASVQAAGGAPFDVRLTPVDHAGLPDAIGAWRAAVLRAVEGHTAALVVQLGALGPRVTVLEAKQAAMRPPLATLQTEVAALPDSPRKTTIVTALAKIAAEMEPAV